MLIAVDNVRSWHLADIDSEEEHVRYWRENGHPRIRYDGWHRCDSRQGGITRPIAGAQLQAERWKGGSRAYVRLLMNDCGER